MSYSHHRHTIYEPLREQGIFNWDWLYGEEYALASYYTIPPEFKRELTFASCELGKIFAKTVGIVAQADDFLLQQLGIPLACIPALRVATLPDTVTVTGRFDFACGPYGVKLLEFNSDTPTGIVEAFYVNHAVCTHYGLENPNRNHQQDIARAFRRMLTLYRSQSFDTNRLYFSALGNNIEDAGTTRYLLSQSGFNGRFVPLEQLRIHQDRLHAEVDGALQPVDILYRLHPLEKLIAECDRDGYHTGEHLLDLVARHHLAIINPPSAFIAQTKALQALIWSLHEQREFFTEPEQEIIQTYMLPTYLENHFALSHSYVTKPIFGREGGAVCLYNPDGSILEQDQEQHYWQQMMIYQQLAPLPTAEVQTLRGPYHGYLLWGMFLLSGQPSAILARIGGRITGNLSYYLPVAYT